MGMGGSGQGGWGGPRPGRQGLGRCWQLPMGTKSCKRHCVGQDMPRGRDLAHPRASECHHAVGFRSLKTFCSFCHGHPRGLAHTMSFFPLLGLKCYSMKWKKVQDPALSLLLPRAELCCPNGGKKKKNPIDSN